MPVTQLAHSWWSLVLRGVAGILVGLTTFVWPGITFGALVLLFGAYALIDGILGLSGAFRASRAHSRWGSLLITVWSESPPRSSQSHGRRSRP